MSLTWLDLGGLLVVSRQDPGHLAFHLKRRKPQSANLHSLWLQSQHLSHNWNWHKETKLCYTFSSEKLIITQTLGAQTTQSVFIVSIIICTIAHEGEYIKASQNAWQIPCISLWNQAVAWAFDTYSMLVSTLGLWVASRTARQKNTLPCMIYPISLLTSFTCTCCTADMCKHHNTKCHLQARIKPGRSQVKLASQLADLGSLYVDHS